MNGSSISLNGRSAARTRDWLVGTFFVAILLAIEYLGPLLAVYLAVGSVLFLILITPRTLLAPPPGFMWLGAIFIIGCAMAIGSDIRGTPFQSIDLQRDLGMLASYMLLFFAGYSYSRRRSTYLVLLFSVAIVGLIISVVQLTRLSQVLASGVSDLYLFRLEAGRGSTTQFTALCSLYGLYKSIDSSRVRTASIFAGTIIAISVAATLSRGLLLFLIVLILCLNVFQSRGAGGLQIRLGRALATLSIICVGALCLYLLIALISPPTRSFIDNAFLARAANSLTEVSASNLQSKNQIIENYRAFEVDKTLQQFDGRSWINQIAGEGWGATVNFGFDTASRTASFTRTSAAFLHNGYAYYLLKTGLVGVSLYLAFMVHLLVHAFRLRGWPITRSAVGRRKALVALVLSLALGTVTTGGLGFPAGYLSLMLIAGAFSRKSIEDDLDEPTAAASLGLDLAHTETIMVARSQ